MSNPNLKPSLRAPVVAMLKSDIHAADNSYTTGVVDMSLFINAMLLMAVGTVASAGTVTLEQATTAAFADAKAIEGHAPVALTTDTPVQVNLKANELDINGGFRFVRAKLTTAGGSVKTGILLLGFDAKDQPAAPLSGTIVAG